MRNAPIVKAERDRIGVGPFATDSSYGNNGAFLIKCRAVSLSVIVSDGGGWDHVSVSLSNRCPTWEEMCFVKEIFFKDDEWVMQLHPAKAENISYHDYCLHMWRPQNAEIPKPPPGMVGPSKI